VVTWVKQFLHSGKEDTMSRDKEQIDWSEKCWKEMLVYQRKTLWLEGTLDRLAVWLGLKPGMTAVDVGCGLGYLGYTYWPYFGKGGRYVGIDASEKLVKQAQKAARQWAKGGQAFFRVGDAYKLPLEDNSADLVMCQALLVHLQHPERALKEMIRVAKPGRVIMCQEPDNLSVLLENWYRSLPEPDIDEQLLIAKVALVSNQGRIKLGQGDGSFGNKVPVLMGNLGLEKIDIRQSDAVFYIQPPYHGPRQRDLLDNVKRQWLNEERRKVWMARERKFFLAGGGRSDEYRRYRRVQERSMKAFRRQVERKEYFGCGSGHIYVSRGRKLK
jgi:ubiquinone/menaquinone biosynthesis C-methylase UbiE